MNEKGKVPYMKNIAIMWMLIAINIVVQAQDKNLIQIKTFDQQLGPLTNIKVSINGKEYIAIDNKGGVFYEVAKEDLPPKSVKISDETLEAESWNYSKGILSIIIRKKSYKSLTITVQNADNKLIPNIAVNYRGIKNIDATTNAQGIFTLPLALNEESPKVHQFSITGYKILQLTPSKEGKALIVEMIRKNKNEGHDNTIVSKELLEDFDMSQIDSIRSLTVFYAVFKNYEIASLPKEMKEKIDAKFHQLVRQLKTEEKGSRFIGKISDSSFVKTDVTNLLAQARYENELLDDLRSDFDRKIKIINEKLSGGAASLDQPTRDKLLEDLNILEQVLTENEDKFYKNLTSYKVILSSLKSSFFDIQNLEQKLEISESKRMEEQRAFRQKILIVVSIALAFGVLVIFLIYLRMKLKRQQNSLIKANGEITRMNENLEELVSERTQLLINANREMDIFLYRASHDLRTPICSIMGLCNIALHSQSSELPDLVKRMSTTAIRMDRMLKKLRVINEINQPSNYSLIRFSDRIEALNHEFAQVIMENNIEVIFDCPNDLTFHSYPALIDTILYNLFDNALFFSSIKTDNAPQVYIRANVENSKLVLSIQDNGIGIKEEIQIKLWDMFFVGNEYSKGNGLGLYLVSKSIQALRGSIDIETKPNVFTLFTVTIPVNTEQVAILSAEVPRANVLDLATV
jgi:signal transduction histidine kinase